MRHYFFLTYALIFTALLFGINLLLFRFLHKEWWRNKYVRWSLFTVTIFSGISLIVWAFGIYSNVRSVAFFGAAVTMAMFLIQLDLVISLPVAAIFNLLGGGVISLISIRARNKNEIIKSRRKFIRRVSAAIPAAMVSSQLSGIVNSYRKIKIPVRNLPIADLPHELEGLKIAHLSDSHLGYYKNLDDLEDAVEEIAEYSPDLVLVTGDISDNLDILDDANRIIAGLNPPNGIFASVGNHEYYRGIGRVLKIFEKSPYPMMINRGVSIDINGVPVYIGGADDPVHLRGVNLEFLRDTIKRTIYDAPSDSFKILMSHRPRGLDFAPEFDINLVLAGHTHGGQLGFGGRSMFESVWPEMYLWGIYQKEKTTLYTSSGMGHWMPFRLGCPAEAPILILQKS